MLIDIINCLYCHLKSVGFNAKVCSIAKDELFICRVNSNNIQSKLQVQQLCKVKLYDLFAVVDDRRPLWVDRGVEGLDKVFYDDPNFIEHVSDKVNVIVKKESTC